MAGLQLLNLARLGMNNVRVLVNPSQMNIANSRLSPNTVLGFAKWEGQDYAPTMGGKAGYIGCSCMA